MKSRTLGRLIAAKLGYPVQSGERLVAAMGEEIRKALARFEEVHIPGVGTLKVQIAPPQAKSVQRWGPCEICLQEGRTPVQAAQLHLRHVHGLSRDEYEKLYPHRPARHEITGVPPRPKLALTMKQELREEILSSPEFAMIVAQMEERVE